MFTTVRDLIEVAYDENKVIGFGMPITGTRMKKAENVLNMILLEEFVAGLPVSKELIEFQFTGARTYTIGTEEREFSLDAADIVDPAITTEFISPDILVSVMPESIDRIVFKSGTIRYDSYPMSSGTYYGRGSDTSTVQYPANFYYERQGFDIGFATINFIGNPTNLSDIVVTTSVDSIDQSTLINVIPKEIIPYITHEMAFRLADHNGIITDRIKMESNRAYALYQTSTDDLEDAYCQDSLRASIQNPFGSADGDKAMRQLISGEV